MHSIKDVASGVDHSLRKTNKLRLKDSTKLRNVVHVNVVDHQHTAENTAQPETLFVGSAKIRPFPNCL